jgi:hypothetical protein
MAEKIFGVLPKDRPPTDFEHQQHEQEACRLLPQLWQPRRPMAAVRNGLSLGRLITTSSVSSRAASTCSCRRGTR